MELNLSKVLTTQIETSLAKIDAEKSLTDQNLTDLFSLLGNVVLRALDIVDRNKVTLFRLKNHNNQRQLLEVKGSGFINYKLYPNINYCPCEAFSRLVLTQRAAYTCKHVLAARFALAVDKFNVVELSQDEFDVRIKQLMSHHE